MSLMAASTIIIFVAVCHRYLSGFNSPVQDFLLRINMGWAQELCIIMFVWMAKFGAAYGVRTGIHVGVDVLINTFSPRKRAISIVFGLVAGAVFTAIVATLGANFVWHNGANYAFLNALGMNVDGLFEGPTTPDLEVQTWIVYSAIPLGSSLMCFRFLQVMVAFLKTGELPHHDHGHVDGVDDDGNIAADTNPYNMDDDLHPKDIKHHR